MDERDERMRSSDDASKRTWTASKPGSPSCSGMSVEDTCLLTTRCPVFRRRDSHLGFRMELETLAGHAKGKGTSGRPARPKVPMGQSGADRPIVAMKRGNARGAKGVGHSRRCWVNGRPEEPSFFAGRRRPSLSGTSRMRRESPVRICERLGVKFPGPTRLTTRWPHMGKLLSIWGSGLARASVFAILDLCGLSPRDMNPLVFEHV